PRFTPRRWYRSSAIRLLMPEPFRPDQMGRRAIRQARRQSACRHREAEAKLVPEGDMNGADPKANRRPLKSRQTGWAALAARTALAAGLSANQISFLGIVVASIGAWALVEAPHRPWLFILGAACVQLRLIANLLDGMVAVEGGRSGPTG